MASGPRSDETKPRRFDLTMSRRTRRPPAATTSATSCHEQDHLAVTVAVDVEGLAFQPVAQEPEHQDPDALLCLSDHLQSRQPEDAHQEHDECEVQQQKEEEEEECQDNSHRFSLQELIEDEAVDDGVKDDDDTGGTGTEKNAGADVGVRDVAEGGGAAAAGAEKRPGQQPVAGRRVIGIMRRYVKVRSIKPKRASPEKNTAPVC